MFVCVPVVGTVVGASLGITVTGSRRWVGVKKIFSLRFAVSQRGCLVYKALVCCRSLYNFRQHFTVHFVMLNILWTYYLPRYVRLIELKMKTFSKKWKRFHFDLLARTDGHRLEPMKFYFENFHKVFFKDNDGVKKFTRQKLSARNDAQRLEPMSFWNFKMRMKFHFEKKHEKIYKTKIIGSTHSGLSSICYARVIPKLIFLLLFSFCVKSPTGLLPGIVERVNAILRLEPMKFYFENFHKVFLNFISSASLTCENFKNSEVLLPE